MYQFSDALRNAYESMSIPLAYYQLEDNQLRPLLVSDGFCRMMGLGRSQLLDHLSYSTFETIHPDDTGKIAAAVAIFVQREGPYDLIYRSRYGISDEYHYVHTYGTWQSMPDGTELVCIEYLDLSSCIDETEKLTNAYRVFQKDHFYTDSITDLPNQNYLREYADERVNALRLHGKTPMLIYVDVISMHYYNSQYGYARGNELLCQIAETLKEVFPEALLMKGPDDHFVLIDAFEEEKTTEEKLAEADAAIRRNASGNTSGIKAGASLYGEEMMTMEAMDRARDALRWLGYDLNRVCHFYNLAAENHYWNERYIVDTFDTALEKGWIRVYYQGISRTETGKGAAMEALARWVDPVRGILSPKEFIPVLEKYHLLHRLDLFMAEQACRDMRVRKEHGIPLVPISINFAAQDFDYENIPARLSQIYNQYCPRLHPEKKYLIVEITEQDMAEAPERFHEQIRQLKKLGFRVWLDDFGSGYSSLNAFSRFGVDLIKFDMDLLRNLDDHNGANRRIMQAMVHVARELGIHTLAEGMETEAQKEFLQEIGCELAQGYLFHRPEPLDATLFKLETGQVPSPCETEEEREYLTRRWFEENEQNLSVIEQFGDHMPGGFFICAADDSGALLYANRAVWGIFGCDSLEEFRSFTGFEVRGMVHPSDYGRVFLALKKHNDLSAAHSESDYMEYRIVRRDGEVRWIDEYSYYVHNGMHRDLCYVFISDITEKRMQEENEKVLRSSVIEALTKPYDSVWIIDDIRTQRFELFRIDEEMAHLMPASEAVKITRFTEALAYYSRLIHEEDREDFLKAVTPEAIVENTKDRRMYSVSFRRIFENDIRYYRLEFASLDLGNGENYIVGGFKNVDEEVRRNLEIRHSLTLRSAVIEAFTQVYDSVWLVNDLETQSFTLYRVDETLSHILPATEAAKISRFSDALFFYSRLILEEDRKLFLDATTPENIAKHTKEKVIYSIPFRRVFETGTRYYRLEFARLSLEDGGTGIVAGFKDVDEEVRRNEELHQALREAIDLAETDLMTGLYNRMTGEKKVSELVKSGQTGMFVLFDVDKFKQFNDTFGHSVGDQVLIEVANTLKNTFRGEDIVMRLGGDEFAAFAPGVYDRQEATGILTRFFDNLENVTVGEGTGRITVSVGAVLCPPGRTTCFRTLYDSADRAMYESKRTGGKFSFAGMEGEE